MMKTLITVLCSLLFVACSTRKKDLRVTEFRSAEIEKVKFDSVRTQDLKEVTKKVIDKKVDQKEKDNSGEVVIKGKTDSLKDFSYYNVVNGDTLSGIVISGTADFTIKNRWKQSEKKDETKESSENLNVVQDLARTAVSKETIKDVAQKAKKLKKEVDQKGFTAGTYITTGICFLVVAVLVWLFFYLGGSWKGIVQKYKSWKTK